MKANVGRLDQILRIAISLIFIYVGFINEDFIYDSLSSNILGTFGVIFLIVAIVRFCPLYTIADINTCHKKEH
jgi:hypothetical protein